MRLWVIFRSVCARAHTHKGMGEKEREGEKENVLFHKEVQWTFYQQSRLKSQVHSFLALSMQTFTKLLNLPEILETDSSPVKQGQTHLVHRVISQVQFWAHINMYIHQGTRNYSKTLVFFKSYAETKKGPKGIQTFN